MRKWLFENSTIHDAILKNLEAEQAYLKKSLAIIGRKLKSKILLLFIFFASLCILILNPLLSSFIT